MATLREAAQEALDGFVKALAIHSEIGDKAGVRADYSCLGRHFMRNERPRDAALAFEASLEALPREAATLWGTRTA